MSSIAPWLGLLVLLAMGIQGCEREQKRELRIFAASSLREAFSELGKAFEQRHRRVRVSLAFAGSQVLRVQIEQGARADVFASAHPDHIARLRGQLRGVEVFAHNDLAVVVPLTSRWRRFGQLSGAKSWVLGAAQVPVGAYTQQMLKKAGARLGEGFGSRVVSREHNVRLVRAKVALGEADAAVVYRTDALASTRVRMIPIPAQFNASATYAIGCLRSSRRAGLCRAWLALLRSPQGQGLLAKRGFRLPGRARR